MATHLAVFSSKQTVEAILKGQKTLEIRFSLTRQEPYKAVHRDDIVLIKSSHGEIVGQAEVENVLYYDKLTPEQVARLRKEHSKEAMLADEYWQKKSKSRYATVIFLRHPERFITPLKNPKHDQRPWAKVG